MQQETPPGLFPPIPPTEPPYLLHPMGKGLDELCSHIYLSQENNKLYFFFHALTLFMSRLAVTPLD